MRLFGYGRVSTSKQCLDIQIERLLAEGVREDRIFTDTATGAKGGDRSGLELLKIKIEAGDIVLVTKLDRLGRSTSEMVALIEYFDNLGVIVKFLDDGISTEGAMGKMVVTILATVAEAERTRIMERTHEGRIEAKAKGIKFGRARTVDREKVAELKKQGMGATAIAKQLGIARASVYRVLSSIS